MNHTPSPEQAKFTKMHDTLDKQIETIIGHLDNGTGITPALFAGISAAKVLLAHAQYTELGEEVPGGWQAFRTRLQATVSATVDAPDTGQPTQFGLFDGLHFAAVEAGKIDGELVGMQGKPVRPESV